MIDGPSEHLSWREIACHDGTEYPQQWRANRAVELAQAFERVRELCGFPLIVNSGYRTRSYNTQIGGTPNSQHVEGRALDLVPVLAGGRMSTRLALLRDAAAQTRREGLLRGIGVYDGFVHIDTRPGVRATWSGSRQAIDLNRLA